MTPWHVLGPLAVVSIACAARDPAATPTRSIVVPQAVGESDGSTREASAPMPAAHALDCKASPGATDMEAAKQTFSAAIAAYTDGDFETAAQSFARSYVLSCRPPILHNLSKCYEQLGNFAEAARTLELYLERAPDLPHAEDVRNRIEALRQRR